MIPFHFQRLQPFEGKSAVIKRPREITEFSFDNKHVCYPLDNRSLRYYYPPMFESPHTDGKRLIDLSQGFETFEKYNDDVNLHLNPLLDTIEAYERQTKSKVQADILTWRGMMTKVSHRVLVQGQLLMTPTNRFLPLHSTSLASSK